MMVGDRFNTKGYEYVASIDDHSDGESGRVVVIHNNSSHYHVAYIPLTTTQLAIDDGAGPDYGEVAILLASIDYSQSDEGELKSHYAVAINLAVAEALRRR